MEGHIYAFTPYFMDNEAFYLNADPDLLVSTFESELAFARDNWTFPGRPTLTVVLTKDMIMGSLGKDLTFPTDASRKNLLNFFMNLRSGVCNNGVRVRLCRLAESLNTSNIASLDFLLEKAMDEWQNILTDHKKGKKISGRRLGFNEYQTQASTPGAPGTPKRRSTSFHGKVLGTPLDKLQDEGYFQDIATVLENMNKNQEPVFRLKDHEGGTPSSSNDSVATPPKIEINTSLDNHPSEEPDSYADDNALSLTLGDSTQLNDAVESLKGSVNLYDQIDLLHYLASCEGIDYYVGDLQATIKALLEEVYLKAVHLQYWSIARQATGLLRKVVPSLTINITDLVIRQKQISIGSGQHEYLISRPVGPETVEDMIGKHCTDDVREGPVVQEILIYLGGFIRTNPSMFDGILRLRTHYIIIALREEIRRINDCNEEEAIEHLMQLSPFELQSLLGTILSGPSLCKDADVLVRDRAAGLLMLNRALESRRSSIVEDHLDLASAVKQVDKKDAKSTGDDGEQSVVVIRAQSGGFSAGNFAKVDINDNTMTANSRGIHVWAVDRHDKLILEHASFDTHISTSESDNFVGFINQMNDGAVLAIVARDDITEHLTEDATSVLESLGSKIIRNVKYRDSYLLITEKGTV
jgi:phosphorylase kinase alpha/beta subunit